MKRNMSLPFLLLGLIGTCISNAQSKNIKHKLHPGGKSHIVSAGALIPLGNFTSTHFMGVSSDYAWSNHRFGRMDVKPVKTLGFTAKAGVSYYSGKKETVSSYSYKYPGFVFLHTYAGILCNPIKNGNFSLVMGPACRFTDHRTQFNIGGLLEVCYYFRERVAVSPAFLFMKSSGTDPLWAASLKAIFAF